jgi:hypothetical protein
LNYTISHETACILNAGDANAHVAITIFFANRPYTLGSMIFPTRNRYRATPITRRYSNPMCRSSCSTRGWTPATRRSRGCRRSPIPRVDNRQGDRLSAITPSTRPS